jgi:prevent-host-death family protein
MQYISATEARATFSDVIAAAQKQPVVIQKQDKDVAVIISPQDYQKLQKVQLQELDDLCRRVTAQAEAAGLTNEKLEQLLKDVNPS